MKPTALKLFLILALVTQQSCSNQEAVKKYYATGFSLEYPSDWEMSNTNDILNFYPKENFGSVTISAYRDITFPLEKTREFILESSQVTDKPENVRTITNQGFTEFYYENTQDGIKWVNKAFRKDTNLFYLTINCPLNKWETEKETFIKVMESFKLN